MKKTLLLTITIFLFTIKSNAQTYHPFPDSNAYWTIEGMYTQPQPPQGWTYYVIGISGDTVIDGNVFHKLFKGSEFGAVRNDVTSKKVYYHGKNRCNGGLGNDTTVVLYDFGLAVGDTFPVPFPCSDEFVVTLIDSVNINGSYRKRLTLNGGEDEWIEGIGSTRGPFRPLYNMFEWHENLICFQKDGATLMSTQVYYNGSMTTLCLAPTAVKQIKKNEIKLTKVSDRSFKLYAIEGPTLITITDLLGKEIGNFNLNTATNEFKIPGASQGIFIISIRQVNKTLQAQKVLVFN